MIMNAGNNFLFNFSVSHSGGGYKRLYEYSKWFNANGGASFAIHPLCQHLVSEFPSNRFFVVDQSRWDRIFDDCGYLSWIKNLMGRPDLYYSYGIPIYGRFGELNWFHLSNVLPLAMQDVPIDMYDRLKLGFLGKRIKETLGNADIVSAESNFSLDVIGVPYSNRLFLSVNGADDELAYLTNDGGKVGGNFATAVGTYRYKALGHALHVFDSLKISNPRLTFRIIGDETMVPLALRRRDDILIMGLLGRSKVIDLLRESKYYISMTHIENSYNAASEGAFLADESYISDIGPHRELLNGMIFESMAIYHTKRKMLHVKREDINCQHLKTWNDVVSEMIIKYSEQRAMI